MIIKTKRIISIIMCLCLILSTLTFTGISASADTDGYYTYTVTDGKATITDVDTSISGDITIPSELGGYPVTSIGDGAFVDCLNLTEISLPDSVTSIGNRSFYGCEKVKDFNLPKNLTSIGRETFVFCNSITEIKIPYGVTTIGDMAFECCTNLVSVIIPDSVTSLGHTVFASCDSLKSLRFPNKITSIERNMFDGCFSLESVVIGKNIKSIAESAFYISECDPHLADVYYKGSEEDWNAISIGGNNTAFDNATIHYNYKEDSDYYTYTVTDGEATITKCDTSISGDITIPNELGGCPVTSIGNYAFSNCTALTSVIIPDNVTNIVGSAFSGCTALISINVNENNSNYCSIDGVLFNKDKTKLIQYPVGNTATSYTIPNSVTSIGDYAFYKCTALTSVKIPNSVTSIGNDAFYGCTKLTSVTIGNGVTSIGSQAFGYCTSLTSITIPDSVTNIYGGAFRDCTSLESITIPNSVTSIVFWVFLGCNSLTDITIPSSVTSIDGSAFGDCTSLTSINVDENNSNYCDIDGVLFNKDKTAILAYPGGKTDKSYTIPDSVIWIGYEAFHGRTKLTSITIPDSVKSIGDEAFGYCTSLTSLNIPDSVTYIGISAFSNCRSLTSITIPNSVTSIDGSAFFYCRSLTSITIPDSVTSIGSDAFRICTSLKEIYILNKDCTIYDSENTINSTATIYGYAGSTAESYATKYSRNFVALNNPVIIDNQVVSTDNSESGFELPEITKDKGLIYFDGENYYKSGDKIPADKGGNIKTVTYESEMESGASARLDHDAGLRFYTQIDKNLINNLKNMGFKVELGTLIAPKDLLNGEELSFDLSEEKYVDVKYSSDVFYKDDTGFEGVVGSLVNIKEKNIAREFVGRGYIKVTMNGKEKIIYSDYCKGDADNNSRSIAFIANKIKNEGSSSELYNKYKDLIDKWADLYKK